MCLSVHIDNRKKDILISSKGSTQELDDATFAAGKEYSINFTEQHKKFCLGLNYNRVNSYIIANGVEIYKSNTKHFEKNAAPLCLGNISKDFSVDNMKKSGLCGYVYDFLVDYDSINADDILDTQNYLIKKYDLMKMYDILFRFI